jgi:hypothetical protein
MSRPPQTQFRQLKKVLCVIPTHCGRITNKTMRIKLLSPRCSQDLRILVLHVIEFHWSIAYTNQISSCVCFLSGPRLQDCLYFVILISVSFDTVVHCFLCSPNSFRFLMLGKIPCFYFFRLRGERRHPF